MTSRSSGADEIKLIAVLIGKVATLEQGHRQFKNSCLTSVECEFVSALRHRAGGIQLLLVIGAFDGLSLNNNPPHNPDMSHTSTECDRPLRNYKGGRSGLGADGCESGAGAARRFGALERLRVRGRGVALGQRGSALGPGQQCSIRVPSRCELQTARLCNAPRASLSDCAALATCSHRSGFANDSLQMEVSFRPNLCPAAVRHRDLLP